MEQLRQRSYGFAGEVSFVQEDNIRLETTRARLSNVLRRHEELKERLSRDSDKMVFLRLQKEFEAARAAQTKEVSLEGEQWNDGLLATIREKVHMEADRKSMSSEADMPVDPHFQEKITYRIGNKIICCLDDPRFGIQYETYFAGEPCEVYHCILESKSFLEKISVVEHTIPFFLPIREAENDLLSSDAKKFIDYVGELLQSYVDRREQVRLIKELYGNQIGDLYHSLAYNLIEFVLDDFDCICRDCAQSSPSSPTIVSSSWWPITYSSTVPLNYMLWYILCDLQRVMLVFSNSSPHTFTRIMLLEIAGNRQSTLPSCVFFPWRCICKLYSALCVRELVDVHRDAGAALGSRNVAWISL